MSDLRAATMGFEGVVLEDGSSIIEGVNKEGVCRERQRRAAGSEEDER